MTQFCNAPLFDYLALAAEIRAKVARFTSMRAAAKDADIDVATFSRAQRGYPTLSHENYLRFRQWLASSETEKAA